MTGRVIRPADHLHDGPATRTGARRMAIMPGGIARREGAPAQAHPDPGQAPPAPQGKAVVGLAGVARGVAAGDLAFVPERRVHPIGMVSERLRRPVIDGPPHDGKPAGVSRPAAAPG